MTVEAAIRNLWGEEEPAELISGNYNPWQVAVPVFGVLIVARLDAEVEGGSGEPIQAYRALLVQPDSKGGYSDESNKVERDAKVVDNDVEVELLPNSSGGDRLVVVLRGAAAPPPAIYTGARCGSCNAPVLWAINEKTGKRVPLDAVTVDDGNIVIVNRKPNGTPIVKYLRKGEAVPDGARYKSHFATCPNADQHRKGK